MTNEEAILRLKNVDIRGAEQEDYDALAMAIKALEQEPCEDAISRQVVLDMMQMKMGAKELYKAAYELSSVKPQEPKWIPVNERLPKAYQKILVTYEEFHWENEHATYGVKSISFGGIVDFIAWMPLPTPYEPQESEGEE